MRSCLILLVLLSIQGLTAADEVQRPNVLFIAIDDLNDYISPLDNHPGIQTPNFDRLAERSVNFTNAHCAAPACHPSRVSVMTGVHPATSGIYRNLFGAHGPRWRHESPVLLNAIVLSQHFRNHGYRAVGGGKIFHTLQWTAGDSQNDPHAWDDYRGDPLNPIAPDWPRAKRIPDAKTGLTKGRPLNAQLFGTAVIDAPEDSYGDHLVADWAIAQLQAEHTQPLFLAVGLFRPHIPWEVSQRWFDLYADADVQLPPHQTNDLDDAHDHGRTHWHQWVIENKQWPKFMRGYLASISYVDHQLGRILNALDESPMKDNTIVVLWSDHGFHIGEKENWEKFALWDQTTHVPLFIHAPGVSQDGQSSQQAVTLTDVYPTLCDLAQIPIPDQCDGTTLVPQLRDVSAKREQLSLTSFQFTNEPIASHAVSDTRYRYIRYGNGFEELYDLDSDPNEFNNLAGTAGHVQIQARLAAHIPTSAAPDRTVPKDSSYNRKKNQ